MIDREIGKHSFNAAEYAIVQRIIHATADFEFAQLIQFSPGGIESALRALRDLVPIITDVGMVRQGVKGMVAKTFNNPLLAAVEMVSEATPGQTRTETGLLRCLEQYPNGIYVIGNAPTALLALCSALPHLPIKPSLVIGAPVGFVSVIESKEALARTPLPYILIQGRKGGSPVAAAILNALLILAWEEGAMSAGAGKLSRT